MIFWHRSLCSTVHDHSHELPFTFPILTFQHLKSQTNAHFFLIQRLSDIPSTDGAGGVVFQPFVMQWTWKVCPHPGNTLTWSPSASTCMQTEHSVVQYLSFFTMELVLLKVYFPNRLRACGLRPPGPSSSVAMSPSSSSGKSGEMHDGKHFLMSFFRAGSTL